MRLRCAGQDLAHTPGETVLDSLERAGLAPATSCRAGHCQSCLMRVVAGEVPAAAQAGLKPTWRAQGWFLPCICRPAGDLEIAPLGAEVSVPATLVSREVLADGVVRLRLRAAPDFTWQAGQFVSVVRPSDGLTRPYSIASLPGEDLELHVRRVPDGRMSPWLCDTLSLGGTVDLRGPSGECIYLAGRPDQPLLLAGTSTGLAPLLGVLRAALAAGHTGPIHLLHGARHADGLYLADALDRLAAAHPQLHVTRSALEGDAPGVVREPLDKLALACGVRLADARAWLCGAPELVKRLRRALFVGGMPLAAIAADAFVVAPPTPRQ